MDAQCRTFLERLQAQLWMIVTDNDVVEYHRPCAVLNAAMSRVTIYLDPQLDMSSGSPRVRAGVGATVRSFKGPLDQRLQQIAGVLIDLDATTPHPCAAYLRHAMNPPLHWTDIACTPVITALDSMPTPLQLRHAFTPARRWVLLMRLGADTLRNSVGPAIMAQTFGSRYSRMFCGRAQCAGEKWTLSLCDPETSQKLELPVRSVIARHLTKTVRPNSYVFAVDVLESALLTGGRPDAMPILIEGYIVAPLASLPKPATVCADRLVVAVDSQRKALSPSVRKLLGQQLELPEPRCNPGRELASAAATPTSMPDCLARAIAAPDATYNIRKVHAHLLAFCPEAEARLAGYPPGAKGTERRTQLKNLVAWYAKRELKPMACKCNPAAILYYQPNPAWFT